MANQWAKGPQKQNIIKLTGANFNRWCLEEYTDIFIKEMKGFCREILALHLGDWQISPNYNYYLWTYGNKRIRDSYFVLLFGIYGPPNLSILGTVWLDVNRIFAEKVDMGGLIGIPYNYRKQSREALKDILKYVPNTVHIMVLVFSWF